ncbi:probable N-acetyltransferase HLS1 [Phalaenopsis equestris]|uniref:probable N-acetyltransferase HLS1 n=1 Tax=Phalaenopsis equestris TaxID=78828 RepID=UPI0009E1B037|nr:probable N-acetyltransferase HLS1 [Phalaenopsis equestris]
MKQVQSFNTYEVVVREYEAEQDRTGAEAVDRLCDVSPSGGVSLFMDLLGDPLCRVRNSPAFLMLVAETCGPAEREIVGVLRGCVKTITCGKTAPRNSTGAAGGGAGPIFTKAGYILGLRVLPSHRRMGIGLKLVKRMEDWFRSNDAEYSYMATDKNNIASLRLFTHHLTYTKFRTPRILVHPVFAHPLPLPNSTTLLRLPPSFAESLYRHLFSTTEFFPNDIDAILNNPLSLGTFLAHPTHPVSYTSLDHFLAHPPASWAVLSVWNSSSLFQLELRGVARLKKGMAWTSRAVDRMVPWLRIPSVPNLFRPFGGYFLYGIGGEGPQAEKMVRFLCRNAHNMAREGGCRVVATEVAECEPLVKGIPYWKRLSFEEDVWCVKRLADEYGDEVVVGDWTRSVPGSSIFVDPREV